MKSTHETAALCAVNDNQHGPCEARIALEGLVALVARAEARRFAERTTPANANRAPSDRTPE